jgi:hypothetical protein
MGSAYTSSSTYTMFSAPLTPGGLPVINPACAVTTSYLRTQATRVIYPTEIFRFQSNDVRSVSLNGDIRYSVGNSSMPNSYENYTGLNGAVRSSTITGSAIAQRRVLAADYGMIWNATKTISLEDQVSYSNVHQPGNLTLAGFTLATPATAGNETINYSAAPLLTGAASLPTGNSLGIMYAYFGQTWLTNNATVSWDASTRATLALTYRYQSHTVVQTSGTGPMENLIGMDTNGAILNAALRPTNHWDINGTAEISYTDNAFTPMTPRQLQHYRVHTLYRPKPWATISGAYNDLERHNNTNNTGTPAADGPLDHEDHTRIGSLGLSLAPNEHYGFDFNYSFSHVYITTNACYASGASTTLPGAASLNAAGQPNLCPNLTTDWGPVKDYMTAPTQYVSVALALSPIKTIHSDIGYRISAVSGSQFFNDAQEVNGSLQSAYQTPYLDVAWTVKPGWIWKAEYNYYNYGESENISGATLCSTSTLSTSSVVPCSTLSPTAMNGEPSYGLTLPRTFHANNLTLGMHYEF